MRIERATTRDISKIALLQSESSIAGYGHIFPPESVPPTIEELEAMWANWLAAASPLAAFIAVDDGVVGSVLAGPDPIEPTSGHVARLYVTPSSWRDGIGSALYDAAINHLREAGFTEATLWVLEHNE